MRTRDLTIVTVGAPQQFNLRPDSLWAHTLTNSVSPSDGPGTWADAVLVGALPSCRRDGGGRLGGQS